MDFFNSPLAARGRCRRVDGDRAAAAKELPLVGESQLLVALAQVGRERIEG